MNIKLTLLCLFFLCSFSSQAQLIDKFLPSNPAAVVHIKPSVIQSKVNIEELRTLPIMENLWNSMKGIAGPSDEESFNLESLGIDANREMYFYVQQVEDGMAMAMVMHSMDEARLVKSLKNAGFEKGGNLDMGNLSVRMKATNFVAWGEGVILAGTLNKTPEAFDPYADMDWAEEPEYMEEEEEVEYEEESEAIEDEIEKVEEIEINVDVSAINENQVWLDQTLQTVLQSGGGLDATKKVKLKKGKGVVTAWMDYEMLMEGLINIGGGMDQMTQGLYANMYKGMEAFVDLQFNNGELLMDANYSYPAQLTRGKDLTDAKVNRKFRKYIKGDDLLGVYSFALNTEAYGNMMKEFMLQAMDGMPETMGLGRDLAPLLGVFIDEEAIYNFFKGDMLVAFTGVKSYEKTTTTYEYDEDFNPIEKEVTSQEKIPEFTAMVSIGDVENMMRILNVGKKMGAMENAGEYFKVMNPMGFDLFMAIKGDLFLISNDTKLITQNLSSGYSNSIATSQWKNVKKNSMYLYWDLPKSLNMANTFGLPVGEKTVNMSRESIKEITWSSPRKQGSNMSSAMRMTFVNEKENALKLILNFMNELFFANDSKTSM